MAETLGEGWPWRRAVTVKQVASDAPGENVAWVEFYANGLQRADGGDIRVTGADGVVVPHRVLQMSGRDDLVRVAFATKGDGAYYVWWGNANAEMPAKELEVRRGVLLEITRNVSAVTREGPATDGAVAAAGPTMEPEVVVAYLLPDLALPYNPVSELRQVTFHYSGTFKIDSAITAQMLLTAPGTATLTIDNKDVRMAPGRRPAPVQLAAGWHTLDIRQVNPSAANPGISLTWQRPTDKAMTAFPKTSFAPAALGVAGNLEKVGAAFTADIVPEAAAEVVLAPGAYAQRYTFEAVSPPGGKASYQWKFGDGQTTTGLRKVNHIFLTPGVYPVTLKLLPEGGPAQETTVRVAIKDRMYERFPKPPVDAAATVRAVLKEYDLGRLSAERAFRGMQYFATAKEEEQQIAWGRAWLTGRESLTIPADDVVARETLALAQVQMKRKEFKAVAETFKLAAAKPIGMETRINLIRQEVMTLCDDVDDAGAAAQEAQAWVGRVVPANPAQVRTAQVALACALIALGDGKGAKAAIDTATPGARLAAASGPVDANNPWRIKVDDALAKKDLDNAATLLSQWELADPQALWTGATRILRVTLAAAEGRHLAAARMALEHSQVNPDGPHAAELLFRAAENYKLGGDQQQANAALELLLKRYADSAFAKQAQPK